MTTVYKTVTLDESLSEDERHKAWLEIRACGIGGSDAGAIIGVNPYRSPLAVWLEKTGREDAADLSGNAAVEWGIRKESLIAEKFSEEHPELAVEDSPGTMLSLARPHALANIDRLLIDQETSAYGVLEVKTARTENGWEDGGIPAHYRAQVTHYLSVTGYSFAWIAVLIGSANYQERYISRDEEDIAALNRLEDEFWALVLSDEMPELIGAADEGAHLATLFLDHNDVFGPVLDDARTVIKKYKDISERIKELETEKDACANYLKKVIGEDKGLEDSSYKVTWIRSQVSTLDTKRLKAEQPAIVAQYTQTKPRDGGLRITERI